MVNLSYIESLARQAGAIQRQGFGRVHSIQYKDIIDIVTEVDRRCEEYLVGEVHSRYPDHSIVAEESGEQQGLDCCAWYIDPLDGTVNYSHGLPLFATSIGYAENGVMQLGVVYDPIRDECYIAEKGHGAFLNGEGIHPSQVDSLNQSLLVTGFPYDIRTNPENNLDYHARLSLKTHGVRRLGSAALDLCYVAAGRLDGFWELSLSPWDIAAGSLIAAEAGAIVTDKFGSQDYFHSPYSIVAATPQIHAELIENLNYR
ncbi:MAG: inositol monophosphatase family protein [Omnitrophica WOR_2 bacterium]